MAAHYGALLVIAIVILPPAFGITKESLYPYSGGGSQHLQSDNNGIMSVEVQLKTPIAFYDKVYNSIFVSINNFRITKPKIIQQFLDKNLGQNFKII